MHYHHHHTGEDDMGVRMKKKRTRYDMIKSITEALNPVIELNTDGYENIGEDNVNPSSFHQQGQDMHMDSSISSSISESYSYSYSYSASSSEGEDVMTYPGHINGGSDMTDGMDVQEEEKEEMVVMEEGDGNESHRASFKPLSTEKWLDTLRYGLLVLGVDQRSPIDLPHFPDVDDTNILDFGSPIFGMSLENDAWVNFSKMYYEMICEVTTIIDYWRNLIIDRRDEWVTMLPSEEASVDLTNQVPHDTQHQQLHHQCTLECLLLDPMDVTNGNHMCMVYYHKIIHASSALYARLIQYYLAGSSINMFTRLVKAKEFRRKDNSEFIPDLTTTMSEGLFLCLQKLRLVCRSETIFPLNLLDFTQSYHSQYQAVSKSINYGMSKKTRRTLHQGNVYQMNHTAFVGLLDEFFEYWNGCYVDENYHIYTNLLLDRMALFYNTSADQETMIDDGTYGKYVTTQDGREKIFYPNFKSNHRMDLYCQSLLRKLCFNKKHTRLHWSEFEERMHLVDQDKRRRREKQKYFQDLSKLFKLWIIYKLQTSNDLLDQDIGERYRELFVTKFQADWFVYHKREIEVDLSYHSSKTPMILLKQLKPDTCGPIIEESNIGLNALFIRHRADPKLRGFCDWVRLYLVLNMFVEGCSRIASRDSPYVLHTNQVEVNYNWFQVNDFPFLYFAGGRYHTHYNHTTIYAHDVPHDLVDRIRTECTNRNLIFEDLGTEAKEKIIKTVHSGLCKNPTFYDSHWYLSNDISTYASRIDLKDVFVLYGPGCNKKYDNPGYNNDNNNDDNNSTNSELEHASNHLRRDTPSGPLYHNAGDTDHGSNDGHGLLVPGDGEMLEAEQELKDLETTAIDAVIQMTEETKDIQDKLFSQSMCDGDTIYDTLLVWISVILNCMKSTEVYRIIKGGLIRSCEILIERIKNVTNTNIELKNNLDFIIEFMEKTRRLENMF